MTPPPRDAWASGDAYEPYVGRWSRPVARELLAWLGLPRDLRWLDLGSGTGALSQVLLEAADPREIVGIDQSDGYVAYARAHATDRRVTFQVADAQSLPFPDARFDAAVSGLVLNFVPDKAKAMGELRRVVRPGGTVAVYLWDYADRMQLIRRFWDASIALDPGARDLDEGRRFPICRPEPLAALFREAGLRTVESRAIDVPTVFRSFDDYWSPFLGGQGPAPGYCASLSEERRAALRDHLRADLPTRPDGTIHLIARAWAARGRVE
ncbi:MAG TPA: class I SAM-dependent methyltransferase [Methylomirabilota bacterium]|nr:class I SAM-dependent methyltransferase [Methylomirabilota bacterium]